MSPLLIELAIEPRSRADHARLVAALKAMSDASVSLGFSIDPETGQTVLKGRDEAALVAALDCLKSEHGIVLNVGAPQVAYCETPSRYAEMDYTHKRPGGGADEFARLKLAVEPGRLGAGYCFENRIANDAVPCEYVPGVQQGLEKARQSGVHAGFPVIDFTAILLDGAYHAADSSVHAFELAAATALLAALEKADCKILEPIMKVNLTVPNDSVSAVVQHLKERRGKVLSVESCRIDALVPLSNMLGYENALNELTQKRGSCTMTFDHYAPVPLPPDDGPFAPAVAMRA